MLGQVKPSATLSGTSNAGSSRCSTTFCGAGSCARAGAAAASPPIVANQRKTRDVTQSEAVCRALRRSTVVLDCVVGERVKRRKESSSGRAWPWALGLSGVAAVLLLGPRAFAPESAADPGPPEQPGEIGVSALLEEMADLSRLAAVANPPFVAHMASSYD